MKSGDKVIVSTSLMHPNEVGIVKEITNKGRIVIQFQTGVGFYTIGKDTIVLVD